MCIIMTGRRFSYSPWLLLYIALCDHENFATDFLPRSFPKSEKIHFRVLSGVRRKGNHCNYITQAQENEFNNNLWRWTCAKRTLIRNKWERGDNTDPTSKKEKKSVRTVFFSVKSQKAEIKMLWKINWKAFLIWEKQKMLLSFVNMQQQLQP